MSSVPCHLAGSLSTSSLRTALIRVQVKFACAYQVSLIKTVLHSRHWGLRFLLRPLSIPGHLLLALAPRSILPSALSWMSSAPLPPSLVHPHMSLPLLPHIHQSFLQAIPSLLCGTSWRPPTLYEGTPVLTLLLRLGTIYTGSLVLRQPSTTSSSFSAVVIPSCGTAIMHQALSSVPIERKLQVCQRTRQSFHGRHLLAL